MPWPPPRLAKRRLSTGMHGEKCRHRLRPASGAPVFANGAATAAMSYAFGSLASNGGGDSSGQSDLMSMSDQELDTYIKSQYGDQLNLDTDMLLAECGACMQNTRMERAYLAGSISAEELQSFYSIRGSVASAFIPIPAAIGIRGAGLAARSLGLNPFSGKSSSQIIRMFSRKGYVPKGPNPAAGRGTFVNPRNGRGYHLDLMHPMPKGPHVGVHRLRSYNGSLRTRDYFID